MSLCLYVSLCPHIWEGCSEEREREKRIRTESRVNLELEVQAKWRSVRKSRDWNSIVTCPTIWVMRPSRSSQVVGLNGRQPGPLWGDKTVFCNSSVLSTLHVGWVWPWFWNIKIRENSITHGILRWSPEIWGKKIVCLYLWTSNWKWAFYSKRVLERTTKVVILTVPVSLSPIQIRYIVFMLQYNCWI